MAEYTYVAADKTGKKVSGTVSAANEGELRMTLRGQGLRPIKVTKAGLAQADIGAMFKTAMGTTDSVPLDKLMNFFRQLQTMISAGVPLMQGLDILAEQEPHPALRRILQATRERVSQGKFLWEALSSYPNTFERVTLAMIQAGEQTGTIDVMLKRIGKYMENSYRLKKLIQSSMYYPIGVIIVAALVIAAMLGFVIPKFEEMLTQSGGELPAITKMMINLSHGFQEHFFLIIGALVVGGFGIRSYVSTPEGAVMMQRLAMNLPLFGQLIIKSGVARFARTLSTLLVSGVPLLDALDICRNSAGNVAFDNALRTIRKEVETGQTLGNSMVRQDVFPKMVSQMCVVGENTGALDKMLERVAEFYEDEVETTVQGMTKLIEPLLIVVLGGIIMVIMIAMYLPIFKMAGSTGG